MKEDEWIITIEHKGVRRMVAITEKLLDSAADEDFVFAEAVVRAKRYIEQTISEKEAL